jgi:hypothetical protein
VAFFSFEKRLQILLIAGALAGAPACYESGSHPGDAGGEDTSLGDAGDGDAQVDFSADDPRPDEIIPPDASDMEEEEWIVVDPLPYPQCNDLPYMSLAVTQADASPTHVVGTVQVLTPGYLTCESFAVCLEAAAEGPGAVTAVTQVDYATATFRYDNPDFQTYDQIAVRLTWHLDCYYYGEPSTTIVEGVAYVCKDLETGNLMVTGDVYECPIFEGVPGPMLRKGIKPRLRLASSPAGDGRLMLELQGLVSPPEEIRWEASAGRIEVLSPAKAVFTPSPDDEVQVVQASIVTAGSVTVEVLRHRKT